MMLITQNPEADESDSPVLVPVRYDVPQPRRLAVWLGVLAIGAVLWTGAASGVVSLLR